MTITRAVALIGVGVMCAVVGAEAHHSFSAQYDGNKPVTLRGTINKMLWSNPHGHLYIDVKTADEATTMASEAADKLLANPIIESFRIEVDGGSAVAIDGRSAGAAAPAKGSR